MSKKKAKATKAKASQSPQGKQGKQGKPAAPKPPPSLFISPKLVPTLLNPPPPLDPPLFVNGQNQVVPNPWEVLGLPANTFDPDAVRSAWRRSLLDHPPEQDPEGALRLNEARDRLLDEKRWAERELGTLHVPNPDTFGLPTHLDPWQAGLMDAQTRLLGQSLLYALLEQDLSPAKR
jgi:hypothetical protein